MAKTNHHVLTVLIIIVSMLLIGDVIEAYMSDSHLVSNYFEVATQILPIVLAFSIFAINWLAYSKSRDNHSLFLGATFLVLGIFDLFNMLSYPYMPDFVTPNSTVKAEMFWAEARIISSILFLASVYIYKDAFPKMITKPVIFTCAVALPLISMALVFLYPSYLPMMHNPDGGLSTAGIMILVVSGSLIIYTIYLYIIRLQNTGQTSNICLIYGLVIIVFSNSVYLFYDYSGHLLKAAGFYFIYFALFKSSIQQPYEKMADAEHKLRYVAEERYRNLFDNANDAIIITDIGEKITSWNRSAETIFGWTSEEVTGKAYHH